MPRLVPDTRFAGITRTALRSFWTGRFTYAFGWARCHVCGLRRVWFLRSTLRRSCALLTRLPHAVRLRAAFGFTPHHIWTRCLRFPVALPLRGVRAWHYHVYRLTAHDAYACYQVRFPPNGRCRSTHRFRSRYTARAVAGRFRLRRTFALLSSPRAGVADA